MLPADARDSFTPGCCSEGKPAHTSWTPCKKDDDDCEWLTADGTMFRTPLNLFTYLCRGQTRSSRTRGGDIRVLVRDFPWAADYIEHLLQNSNIIIWLRLKAEISLPDNLGLTLKG